MLSPANEGPDCGCGPTHDCGCGGHDHAETGLDMPGDSVAITMVGTMVGAGVLVGILGTLAVQALAKR